MRLPRPCLPPRLTALLLAVALLPACGRQALGPGVNSLSLTPADSNRDRLVGHLLVPSLARTYATVDALRAQGALPFGAAELQSLLAARLNIPVEVLDVVDANQPMALAMVTRADPPPGDPGMLAGACTLKPAEAAAAAAVLGAAVSSQKDIQEFRRPDGGSLWVLRSGTTFLWADTREALGEAGAHAAAARGEAADDIVVRAYPPALARWRGADPASGVPGLKAKLLEDYDRSFRERDRPTPPASERAAYEAVLDFVLAPLPDTNQLEFTLGLAEARGARFGLRATPRPRSAFATRLATPTPVAHPPALLEGTGHVALAATGPSPAMLELYQGLLDTQARAGVTGAQPIAARVRALTALLTGALATSARAAGNGITVQDTVLGLRPGTSPAAALDALVALARDPALAPLLQAAYGSQAPAVTAARENTDAGPGARIQMAFPPDARPRGPAAIVRSFYGTSTVVLQATAAGDRLLLSTDPGAGDRLRRIAAGAAAAPDPAMATALEDGRGRDGFLYLDLWGLVRPMVAAFMAGSQARLIEGLLAMPGLSQLSLPVWANHRGGEHLEVELRVPVATMSSAASAIGLFGQAGGLGMAP